MATVLDSLKPYRSLLLGRFEGKNALSSRVEVILDDLSDLLSLNSPRDAAVFRGLIDRAGAAVSGNLTIGFLHYVEERTASWTSDPSIKDRFNHLVLVAGHGNHIAILLTDSSWKRKILQQFVGDNKTFGLAALRQIPSGLLNAAFVQGATRTLWLTGTHRRTSVKADNKVLSGISLQDALDPLEDQTFYFTAARCVPKLKDGQVKPIGVVPRGSRIWAGTSKDWQDCRDAITGLLSHLESVTAPQEAPLPVLAVSTSEVGGLEGAFDVSLQPPEALADAPGANREELEEIERFAYGCQFQILDSKGPDFKAKVWLYDRCLGLIDLKVDLSRPERVSWEIEEDANAEGEEDYQRLLDLCRRRDWLKIRYDSGHTLSDGAIFKIRHRDFPFEGFDWVDFQDFDFWEEKPYLLKEFKKTGKKVFAPDEIGKQKSLFCWVQRFWPSLSRDFSGGGWLACDDGAMEIADFIHLDLKGSEGRPDLTLIHVKGSGSKETTRGISVSNYEVVVGQAVKNLRSLDRMLLGEGLAEGLNKKIGKLVWTDRAASSREAMLRVLGGIGANYNRKIVVLQPHLTRSAYDQARKTRNGKEFARLQQLDTLLLSARASCNALGADFRVITAA